MNLFKITAILASIFSVLFSLSILKELYNFIGLPVFVFSSIFLILFVIYNEISKVKEVRKRFRGLKSNLAAIITTFVISFILSGVGIWFWTNDNMDKSSDLNSDLKTFTLQVEQEYQSKVDSLNLSFLNTSEYLKINEDIDFWRNRKSDSKEQRQEILQNIRDLEAKRDNLYTNLDSSRKSEIERLNGLKSAKLELIEADYSGQVKSMDKNNLISLIFFIMVIVTEFIILNVQRQIVNFYTKEQRNTLNVVQDCIYRGDEFIDINEFKFNKFNPYSPYFKDNISTNEQWDETKKGFNLLKSLSESVDGELVSLKGMPGKLRKYFNQVNEM